MAIQITLTDLAAGREPRTATKPRAAALIRSLRAQCGDWLRRRNDAARLRELDPHLAEDIGVAPVGGRGLEGFVVDPEPLWGIGLAPMPRDPRAERRLG